MMRHLRDNGNAAGELGFWGRMFPVKDRNHERMARKASLGVSQLESRRLLSADIGFVGPEPTLLPYVDPRTGEIFVPDASTMIASNPTAGSPVGASAGTLYPLSSVPVLDSLPGAHASIYLDFIGDYEASWGSYSQISTPAFDTDGDPTTFSDSELSAIQSIWSYVAEDYSPFNINVTTVAPPSFDNGAAVKMVIGGAGAWMGQVYGGISYIDSFTNDMPNVSFVFSKNLGNGNARYTADATSHEAGHDFGLSHQSTYSGTTLTQEYSTGPGNGTAPIMGNSYYAGLSRWWNGTSDTSSTTYQDDMSVIASAANGFGYRPESAGTTPETATLLTTPGDQVSASGVILTGQDINYYTVLAGTGTATFTVQAAAGYNNLVPTIQLYDATGTVLLASASASGSGSTARFSYTISEAAGYRVVVRSDGTYGNAGLYSLSATIPTPPGSLFVSAPSNLTAAVAAPSQINVSWTDNSSNATGIVLLRSDNGGAWATIANLPAGSTSYSDGSVAPGITYAYRVFAFSPNMTSAASNATSVNIPAEVTGPPASASGLVIVSRSSNAVTLSWTDNAATESGYRVQRSLNGGKTWTTIAEVAANTNSYTDRSVKASKRYLYRVVGFNAKGNASPSNSSAVTTAKISAAHVARQLKAGKALRSAKPQAAAVLPSLAQPAPLAASSTWVSPLPAQGAEAVGIRVDWTPVIG